MITMIMMMMMIMAIQDVIICDDTYDQIMKYFKNLNLCVLLII